MRQLPALLVVVPLAAALLAPLIAPRSLRWMRAMALLALTTALLLSAAALGAAILDGPLHYRFGGWNPPWGIAYVVDPLGALMALLVSFFSLLGFFGLGLETRGWTTLRTAAFYALYLLLTAGLIGISVTGDLFNLYVFLEISALSAYALVAAGGDRGQVAAFRYLIIGSVAASFWVLGIGYLYAVTGTLNMADMARLLTAGSPAAWHSPAAVAGLSFIVAGLAIKMALFPLHGWQPDAYAHAPASVMPLLSGIMAKVAAYVLLRLLYWVFVSSGPARPVLEVLGPAAILSIIAGSVLALSQKDLRRMLAYSSVSQIGYVVAGFSLGLPVAALLHLIYHAFMKSCLFLATAGFQSRTGTTDIPSLTGLGARMPWTAALFTAAALSMIGLPPLCGFFSKFYLIRGAIAAEAWPYAVTLGVSSLLSAVYFFRVIEVLYLKKPAPPDGGKPAREAPAAYLAPALVLAAGVFVLGLANQALINGVIKHAVPPHIDSFVDGAGIAEGSE